MAGLTCSDCGNGSFRTYPRLAGVISPAGCIVLCVAAIGAAILGGVRGWPAPGILASVAVACGALILPRTGMFYWGGLRCTVCGRARVYR